MSRCFSQQLDCRRSPEYFWFRVMPVCGSTLVLLLGGLWAGRVLSICPSQCSCSEGHRVVDCCSRGLTRLPNELQHNIRFLNLSFNRLQALDGRLGSYVQLRTLDLSSTGLQGLPELPRSLWELRVAGNRLHALDKNHTAYHWNLRWLDLSRNQLERVVFINNTLPALLALNLSHNRFWTVPTNLPRNLHSVDLSHNLLRSILPRSLDLLPRLEWLYLHANRFAALPGATFQRLERLQLLTLGQNPWACEEESSAALLQWAELTQATVLGCPCHTTPICGQAPPTTTQSATAAASSPTIHQEETKWAETPPGVQAPLSSTTSRSVAEATKPKTEKSRSKALKLTALTLALSLPTALPLL